MAYYATYMQDETGELQKVVINAGVGFCLPFYGTEAPPGTLACDGSEISREAYKELFQVLGTKAGAGDGVSTFNLPDMRGVFVRGTGGSAAALGTTQGDAIRNITGSFAEILYQHGTGGISGPSCLQCFYTNDNAHSNKQGTSYETLLSDTGDFIGFDASRVVPTAAENRPVNVALLWCIIYE